MKFYAPLHDIFCRDELKWRAKLCETILHCCDVSDIVGDQRDVRPNCARVAADWCRRVASMLFIGKGL